MSVIIAFILKYWIIIIVVCVLLLMGFIGYYADSNNLVESSKDNDETNDLKIKIELDDEDVADASEESNDENPPIEKAPESTEFEFNDNFETPPTEEVSEEQPVQDEQISEESNEDSVENIEPQEETKEEPVEEIEENESFEQFEQYFNQVLPEKSVISHDLDKYIDDLKIDTEENDKIDESLISDIELPEIKEKELETSIWV